MNDELKPKKRLMEAILCPNCKGHRIYYDDDYGDTCECWMCYGHGDIFVPVIEKEINDE